MAIEAPDITFLSSGLARLPEVLALAGRALGVIRQDILLSAAVTFGAIVLAGVEIVTPVLGALLHETSAKLVVVNPVRLIEWRPAGVLGSAA